MRAFLDDIDELRVKVFDEIVDCRLRVVVSFNLMGKKLNLSSLQSATANSCGFAPSIEFGNSVGAPKVETIVLSHFVETHVVALVSYLIFAIF